MLELTGIESDRSNAVRDMVNFLLTSLKLLRINFKVLIWRLT